MKNFSRYLNGVKQDFNQIRIAGLKCLVRFAYSNEPTLVGSLDANRSQILAHISQLNPILVQNTDVIVAVQVGFKGTWGEWYYTDNFGYPVPNVADIQNRRAVVNALLTALPTIRMIQMRTPSLKLQALNSSFSLPLTQAEAKKILWNIFQPVRRISLFVARNKTAAHGR